MSYKILARGAEAVIEKKGSLVIKKRVPKGYRHSILDQKLRTIRTRAEVKLLQKVNAIIPSPKVKNIDEQTKTIILEHIRGKKLADHLEKIKNSSIIAKQIGTSISRLHDANIIHGDLTTSNMIYNDKDKKVYIIDFGLGFHSSRVEDKAVDLHVLKEALKAKHPKIYERAFSSIISGYKSSKQSSQVLRQLEKVEKRGRYKSQY